MLTELTLEGTAFHLSFSSDVSASSQCFMSIQQSSVSKTMCDDVSNGAYEHQTTVVCLRDFSGTLHISHSNSTINKTRAKEKKKHGTDSLLLHRQEYESATVPKNSRKQGSLVTNSDGSITTSKPFCKTVTNSDGSITTSRPFCKTKSLSINQKTSSQMASHAPVNEKKSSVTRISEDQSPFTPDSYPEVTDEDLREADSLLLHRQEYESAAVLKNSIKHGSLVTNIDESITTSRPFCKTKSRSMHQKTSTQLASHAPVNENISLDTRISEDQSLFMPDSYPEDTRSSSSSPSDDIDIREADSLLLQRQEYESAAVLKNSRKHGSIVTHSDGSITTSKPFSKTKSRSMHKKNNTPLASHAPVNENTSSESRMPEGQSPFTPDSYPEDTKSSSSSPSDEDLRKAIHHLHLKRRVERRETRLHYLCQQRKPNAKKLQKTLRHRASDASTPDPRGNLPLHIIARNESAIFSRQRHEMEGFIHDLVRFYPEALVALNDDGCIPFTSALRNWIEYSHATSNYTTPSMLPRSRSNEDDLERIVPYRVQIPSLVDWSFKMISSFIEHSEDLTVDYSVRHIRTSTIAETIVKHFCTIPFVIKTTLLIEDDLYKNCIFELPVFRRSLLRKEIIGKKSQWLVAMLSSGNYGSSRAIDFFEMVSDVTIAEGLGLRSRPLLADYRRFNVLREGLFRSIDNLDGFIPALFLLDGSEIERASQTYAVQRILDMSIMKPSLIAMLIFDFSLHLLLLFAYPVHINAVLSWQHEEQTFVNLVNRSPWLMILWICAYFLLRNLLSIIMTFFKRRDILSYFFNFWHIIEIISPFIVSVITIWTLCMQQNLGYNPFLVICQGLIWWNFLGFLIAINKHLATFFLSLAKLLSSMKWFLVVLAIVCCMFVDMTRMIALVDPKFCAGFDPSDPSSFTGVQEYYCEVKRNLTAYARAYAMLVGDISFDDYQETPLSTILFIFFTAVGVIILLNVLIAIIVDEYEHSAQKSYGLLGSARIALLAKHERTEAIMKPILTPSNIPVGVVQYSRFCFVRGCRCVLLLAVIAILQYSFVVFFRTTLDQEAIRFTVLALLPTIIADVSLLITGATFLNWDPGFCLPKRCFLRKLLSRFIFSLLGVKKSNKILDKVKDESNGRNGRWIDSVREIVEQSEARIKAELKFSNGKNLGQS